VQDGGAPRRLLPVKNRPFLQRLRFALAGIRAAIASEASFRTQLILATLAGIGLAVVRPPLGWVVAYIAAAAAVLAAELFNTALERIADRLHPERHLAIEIAKDCAAAAVLLLAIAAAIVGLAAAAVALHLI
jgi:undecaprenol kinase